MPSRVNLAWYLSGLLLFGSSVMLYSKCHRQPSARAHKSVTSVQQERAPLCKTVNRSAGYVEFGVAGLRRRFYLVPPSGSGAVADLIIGFHGRSRSGEYSAHYWALGESPHQAFVALYPDGVPQPWFRNLVGWDTRSEASADLPFYDALVEWAVAEYCVDRSRIHLLGHSWGGGMANLVACARAGIRSLVSVGGGGPTFPCQGPVAAMIVHGTADQDEPLVSGQTNVNAWSFYNRCGAAQSPASVEGCVAFADCIEDHPLLWCEHPGGHGWPDLLRNGKLLAWLARR